MPLPLLAAVYEFPATVTRIAASGSSTVPFKAGEWLAVVMAATVTAGGVLSILNAAEVNVALLPAMSVTVTVPVTLLPSVVSTNGLLGELVLTPESASAVV